jgi:hypothetical protein
MHHPAVNVAVAPQAECRRPSIVEVPRFPKDFI